MANPNSPPPSRQQGEQPTSESSGVSETTPPQVPAQDRKPSGTVTFNGSSYSGVDIKVLVHKHTQPSNNLAQELQDAIGVYKQVSDSLSELSVNVFIQATDAVDVIGFYRDGIEKIKKYEASLTSQKFNQHVAYQFPQNPFYGINGKDDLDSTIDLIRNTKKTLDTVIADWKSQTDAVGKINREFMATKVLAELQTISISTFREKTAVRACGTVGVKGYTRGPRTIAGSMIFTVFDRNVLFELQDISSYDANKNFHAALKDQLPPLDLTISFANEYGALSRMALLGVEFVSEGQTMSIEDMILEDVCQFVARDIDPMTPVLNENGESYSSVLNKYNQAIAIGTNGASFSNLRASDLTGLAWDNEESNTIENRFRRRNYPFR